MSSIRTRSPRLVEDGHRAVAADVDPKEVTGPHLGCQVTQ